MPEAIQLPSAWFWLLSMFLFSSLSLVAFLLFYFYRTRAATKAAERRVESTLHALRTVITQLQLTTEAALMNTKQASTITQEVILRSLEAIAEDIRRLPSTNTEQVPPMTSDEMTIIRDLVHTLRTPLSSVVAGIKAERISQQRRDGADPVGGVLLSEPTVLSVFETLEVANSILDAYGALAKAEASDAEFQLHDLRSAVDACLYLHAQQCGKAVDVSVDLPEQVHGYGNGFLMALLLPLLQNAVEGASNNTGITVIGRKRESIFEISIGNLTCLDALPDGIYTEGYTSKPDHNGIGLSTVKRLLSRLQGGKLTHTHDDGRVEFAIELPIGGS